MKLVGSFLFSLLTVGLLAQSPAQVCDLVAEYGRRARYSEGLLRYPEFILRFEGREERRPAGTNLLGIIYTFAALDRKGEKIAGFRFTFSGLAVTTAAFEVGGKTFVAELTYSTAGQPVPREVPPKQNGELTEGEIVVWDESTARSGNLQLLEFWKKKEANQPPEPTPTAVTPPADAGVAPAAVVAHL